LLLIIIPQQWIVPIERDDHATVRQSSANSFVPQSSEWRKGDCSAVTDLPFGWSILSDTTNGVNPVFTKKTPLFDRAEIN
jgi:hypothetical protein